jgi:OFA family oxalate/formate antiporter-like MFS transporter
MTATQAIERVEGLASPATRLLQLVYGIIVMVMIASLQYSWTLFVGPIDDSHHWGRAAIQVAFTIYILAGTWLVPFEGYAIDRLGIKLMVCLGGVLIALGWIVNSMANSLALLYLGAVFGGVGAGTINIAAIGNALKWFPDRRGLAVGVTSAGFGAGSALTIIPIANMIHTSGYQAAFLWFGIGQGLIVFFTGLLLRTPRADEVPVPVAPAVQQTRRSYGPNEALKTPVFYMLYLMFVLVCSGGLMAAAQLAPIAKDWKIAEIPVSLAGITLPALIFALSLDRICNGIARPLFGFISDYLGRENTMFLAFMIEGIGIYSVYVFGQDPLLFVILSGVLFFAWGEIYSLFPAMITDVYGPKFVNTNYGMLFTAKGVASLLVPLGNVMTAVTGSWHLVFAMLAAFNIVAALMALALKPARARLRASAADA